MQRIICLWSLKKGCPESEAAVSCTGSISTAVLRGVVRQLERGFPGKVQVMWSQQGISTACSCFPFNNALMSLPTVPVTLPGVCFGIRHYQKNSPVRQKSLHVYVSQIHSAYVFCVGVLVFLNVNKRHLWVSWGTLLLYLIFIFEGILSGNPLIALWHQIRVCLFLWLSWRTFSFFANTAISLWHACKLYAFSCGYPEPCSVDKRHGEDSAGGEMTVSSADV